ncbi:MAG: DUF3995 domain-containing protein [Actinomycetota bacterium]
MGVTAGLIAAAILLAVAGLHVHWAQGGPWPAHDQRELVELVAPPGGTHIPPGPTYVVAALLMTAAVLVATAPLTEATLVSLGAFGVAGVLAVRGVGGLVVSGLLRRRSRFARLDRRWYSPLCLGLAGLSATAAL